MARSRVGDRSFKVRIFRESIFFFRQKAGVRVIFIERSKRRKNFLKLVLAFVLKIVFW